ncbi:MAG: hypothetical protein ACW97O_06825 [Candidatus Thorarchaeota archaeon]|jgi:hypothetical protein
MLEVKTIPSLKKAIAKISPMKKKQDDLIAEHPDLKMIRRYRASEAAIKNLERIRDIDSNRSSFIR